LKSLALRDALDYARIKGHRECEKLLSGPPGTFPREKIQSETGKYSAAATKALIDAIRSNDLEKSITALKNGAEVNPGGNDVPIIIAAAQGHTDIVEFLICQGADVNRKDVTDYSALAKACGAGYVDIVTLLLDHGAQVDRGVEIAVSVYKRPDILKLIKKARLMQGCPNIDEKKKETPDMKLIQSASDGSLVAVKTALSERADLDAQDADGATALFWASRKGFIDIVKLLLEAGADTEIKTEYQWTALMEAALNGHYGVVETLLDNGADLNAATYTGATSVVFASAEGHTEVVRLLLEKGAEPNTVIKDGQNKGKTALSFAREGGHGEIVNMLIQAGAGEL
jgi:ankyrin repeat protein